MLKVDLESCLQVQADIVHHINYKHDPQTFDNQMCNNTFYINSEKRIYHFIILNQNLFYGEKLEKCLCCISVK